MGTRQETRYSFLNNPNVTVVLDRALPGGGVPIAAEFLDISRGGAKLRLTSNAPTGAGVVIHLQEMELSLNAKVCWCHRESENQWWAACLFEPSLSADVLERLMDDGYLERRRHPREPVELTALAKWCHGEAYTVEIRDFSPGGMCFSAPRGAQRDQRLLLELDQGEGTTTAVLVQVRWQIKFEDGYLIGCTLINRQGLSAIRRLAVQREAAAPPTAGRGWLRSSLGRLISLFNRSTAGRPAANAVVRRSEDGEDGASLG